MTNCSPCARAASERRAGTSRSSTTASSSTRPSTTSAWTSCANPIVRSSDGRSTRACGRGRPPLGALTDDGGILQPDRVRIRAFAEVAASYMVTDPRAIDALSPYYVWTPSYAEKRLRWKRRHPLHVILLRTYRIPRPVTVKVRDEYLGCRSWLEVKRDLPFEGTPVLSDEEFERAAEEIERIASAAQPVLA
ncbi:MAG: DUF1802 family protein [Thermoleophilaceae bacterium]